jgi:sensor histidine kinase YesM
MTTVAYRKESRIKLWCYHVLAWALYAGFIYGANFLADRKLQLLPTLVFLLPFCLTFYVSVFFLNLYKEKGVLWSIASFFLVFFLMGSLGYAYVYWLMPKFGVKLFRSTTVADYLKSILLGYVQYFSYALLYFYIREWFRKEKRLRKVEAEKLQHELENSRLKERELQAQQDKLMMEFAFLRAQVNPHFLHNTLNVLFEQAMDHSEELADNIAKLSRIMRYSLESIELAGDRVPIEKELEHLRLLLDFHKLRFEDTKLVEYKIVGIPSGQCVPPLSLITVVENAFKHGDLKDADHPLQILVGLENGLVYFFCRNKKRTNHLPFTSHSIGMNNLKRRLDVAFAEKYELQVKEEDLFYQFELTFKS